MRKILTNWRYYALLAIALVAAVGIFSLPDEEAGLPEFTTVLLATKAVGIAAAVAFIHLLSRWCREGSIEELRRLLEED